MGANPFENLDIVIASASSIRGALFCVRDAIDELAGHDISYEFMLRKTSFIKADLINVTTLSPELISLYMPAGGTNSDPVIENTGDMTAPTYVDLNDICYRKGTKYYKNAFFTRLIGEGCPYLSAFPFNDALERGYGVFTIFDSRPRADVEPLADRLSEVGRDLHKAIRTQGLYQSFFGLGDKELSTLEHMAIGRTADDIAALDGVSRRTIELRLGTARKKLKARNSTEAVFKAVSYGLINPE